MKHKLLEAYLSSTIELVCLSSIATVWNFNLGTLPNNTRIKSSYDRKMGKVNILTIVDVKYSNEGTYECVQYKQNSSGGGFTYRDYTDVKVYLSPTMIIKGCSSHGMII